MSDHTLSAILALVAAFCILALWMTLECHGYGCGRLPTRFYIRFTKFKRWPSLRWDFRCKHCDTARSPRSTT